MISTYNTCIFLTIIAMATTPTTMKPPTIASVLASNSVGTPAASTPTSSGSSGGSSTSSANQAQLEANRKAAAEREAARQAALVGWPVTQPTSLKAADPSQAEGTLWYFISRGYDPASAANLVKNYNTKMSNTYEIFNDPNGWTYYAQAPNWTPIASTITWRAGPVKIDTPVTPTIKPWITPAVSQRVQVGKLVSDFKVWLGASGWDRVKYNNSINYDSLSPNAKVVADRLFDSKKKDDEPTPVAPVNTRAWLKVVTPTIPADSVAGIRAANPGMSIVAARAEAEKRRLSKIGSGGTTTPVVPSDKDTTYLDETKAVIDTIKSQAEIDKQAQLDAAEENKRIAAEYNNSMITEHQDALTSFENEQNALVAQYEGNRLNQVQWDLRRLLLERGVDISKVTPEQLIALSGSVGVNAFNDISAAKEKAKASVETARQNALAKISQLKANNVLNESQYNTAVADINSKSATANNNLDLKFAEMKFGVATNKEATQKADALATSTNILSTAQALGVTGTQMGLVQSFIANAKNTSTPEALARFLAELQNQNSPLYITLKSNEDAASKKAQFDAALKQYEAETDRIKADAAVTSANRPRSSGSTVYVNPINTGTVN